MRTLALVVVVAAGFLGCGPAAIENHASGGAGGGAGAAGGSGGAAGRSAATGGSGGAEGGAPAAGGEAGGEVGGEAGAQGLARGAVEIRLSPPSSAGPNIGTRTACTAGTTGVYTYFLGQLAHAGLTAGDRVRTGLMESGQAFTVDCTVMALGEDGYSVRASLSGVDANSRHVATSVTLEGTVAADATLADSPGTVALYTPDTGSLTTIANLPACTIGPVYVVKEGALLADFTCPVLGDSGDTIKGCQASGTIAVERCLVTAN